MDPRFAPDMDSPEGPDDMEDIAMGGGGLGIGYEGPGGGAHEDGFGGYGGDDDVGMASMAGMAAYPGYYGGAGVMAAPTVPSGGGGSGGGGGGVPGGFSQSFGDLASGGSLVERAGEYWFMAGLSLGEVEAPEGLDLAKFAEPYTKQGQVIRLMFLAQRVPSLRPAAAALAAQVLRRNRNVTQFASLALKWRDLLPADASDDAWQQSVMSAVEADKQACSREIAKEGGQERTRTALLRLATILEECGQYDQAIKQYRTALQYNSTAIQNVETAVALGRVTWYHSGRVSNCARAVSKALEHPQDAVSTFKLRALSALSNIDQVKFSDALSDLLAIDHTQGECFNEIATVSDLALYAGIIAMATLDRSELYERVIAKELVCEFLAEGMIRDAIIDMHHGRYAACWSQLDSLSFRLRVDPIIASVSGNLLERIRVRCVQQYCKPYSCISIQSMATAFAMGMPELEKYLAKLIAANDLPARIDSATKVLRARRVDSRAVAYANVVTVADKYSRFAQSLLTRVAMDQHHLVVSGPPKHEEEAGEPVDMMATMGHMQGSHRRAYGGK